MFQTVSKMLEIFPGLYRAQVGGYVQVGSKGQTDHCVGVSHTGLADSGQSLLLEELVLVPF